jgi:hypothetical protein
MILIEEDHKLFTGAISSAERESETRGSGQTSEGGSGGILSQVLRGLPGCL